MANAAYYKVYRRSPRGRFDKQKYHAKRRGIAFRLTFAEWWAIWQDSGHWAERGRKRGCYCMARFGDVGAYEIGNVAIVLYEVNTSEPHKGVPRSAEIRAKIRASAIVRWTDPEERAKARAAAIVRFSDPEERRRTSERQLAYFAKRKGLG
jgi:hypothetical protein